MTHVELQCTEQNSLQNHGEVRSSRLLDVLDDDRARIDIPRNSLDWWLDTQSVSILDWQAQESDMLGALGFPPHLMAFPERVGIMNAQRRVLIIGFTEESMQEARTLLADNVAVVFMDRQEDIASKAANMSIGNNYQDIFHHPLAVTVPARKELSLSTASQVFHGVYVSKDVASVAEIQGIHDKLPQVIDAHVFDHATDVEVTSFGTIKIEGRTVGSVARRRDGHMGKIYVVGDDPYDTVRAARQAVGVVLAYEQATRESKQRIRKEQQKKPNISKSAQQLITYPGHATVTVNSGESASDIVTRESYSPRALRTVVIAHNDGIAAFERIGITREDLAKEGISVSDGREITAISTAPLTSGLHVESTWHVTQSQVNAIKQTEGVGAVIVASGMSIVESALGTPVIGLQGKTPRETDINTAFHMRVTPKPSMDDYKTSTVVASIAGEIPVEFLNAPQLVSARQEHLVTQAYQALGELLRRHAHDTVMRIKHHDPSTPDDEAVKRRAAYIVQVAEALDRESHIRKIEINGIGIPDMFVTIFRYGRAQEITDEVSLGVRVLHDGSVQLMQADGSWEPIELTRMITNPQGEEIQIVDHRRPVIRAMEAAMLHTSDAFAGETVETRLISHILRRLGMYHARFDMNMKYSSAIFGLRGARRKHLAESVGKMFPIEHRGSVYQTPAGGLRISFSRDGSSHAQSMHVGASGMIERVSGRDVAVNVFDRSLSTDTLEQLLAIPLVTQTQEELRQKHEIVVRSLISTSLRMLLCPYGVDVGDTVEQRERFVLKKYFTGADDGFGGRETYYAVSYKAQGNGEIELGIHVLEDGTVYRFNQHENEWVAAESDASLVNHMLEQLAVPASYSLSVPVPALRFIKQGIARADNLLQEDYLRRQLRAVGRDGLIADAVIDDAPIVFSPSGYPYGQTRTKHDTLTTERIQTDRGVRRYISRIRFPGDRPSSFSRTVSRSIQKMVQIFSRV